MASRRQFVKTVGASAAAIGGTAFTFAQTTPPPPPGMPPRDFGANAPPTHLLRRSRRRGRRSRCSRPTSGNTPIKRLWTGALWAEGPAWNAAGRYLVWSDIPNNRQFRWLEDDGQVAVFRAPSNNSNGNTFDFQGRQLSCEHVTRRVVRYEHDGAVTVIAEAVQRQATQFAERRRAHPDGSYLVHRSAVWRAALRRRRDPQPARSCRPASTASITSRPRSTHGDRRRPGAGSERPRILARLQTLYVVSTGKGPGDTGAGGKGEVYVVRRRRRQPASNRRCSPIAWSTA